jgi:hypothetical protein
MQNDSSLPSAVQLQLPQPQYEFTTPLGIDFSFVSPAGENSCVEEVNVFAKRSPTDVSNSI